MTQRDWIEKDFYRELGVASGAAFPFNPSRTGLIFYNSSSGVAIAVCPAVVNVGSGGVYPGFQAGIAVINGAGSISYVQTTAVRSL